MCGTIREITLDAFMSDQTHVAQISVLTVAHNTDRFIEGYFRGVQLLERSLGVPVEVLIYSYDSSSSFNSKVRELGSSHSHFELFEGDNLGFGRANNFLVDRSSGDVLMFLNPDTEIVEVVSVDSLLNLDTNSILGLYQFVQSERRPASPLLGIDFWFHSRETESKQRALYVDGAGLVISRSLFDEVGRFDENIFLFVEDVDLCFRGLAVGASICATKSITIWHQQGGTATSEANTHKRILITSGNRRQWTVESQLYVAFKWLPRFILVLWLLTFLLLSVFGVALFVLTGRWQLAASQTRGFVRGTISGLNLRSSNRSFRESFPQVWKLHVAKSFKLPSPFSLLLKYGVPTESR
jgi:GT2 family glycosyltransferase